MSKYIVFISCLLCSACAGTAGTGTARAVAVLDTLYAHYAVDSSLLLVERFPQTAVPVTYLADAARASRQVQYAYLWPFSGTMSAATALLAATDDDRYRQLLDERVLPGLEMYRDTLRLPVAYASYIRTSGFSDRFYDDNVWLGIDFTEAYRLTGDADYLERARGIWHFLESGMDDVLGGGMYWCEQRRDAKHACSSAPAAVLAFNLFEITRDSAYLAKGRELFKWTYEHLRDPVDDLYFDNLRLDGQADRAKYSYNSGQMLQAAAMLYSLTGDAECLEHARRVAVSCAAYFFREVRVPDGRTLRLLRGHDIWFASILFRGYDALHRIDGDDRYVELFRENLDYAWEHARDGKGLFESGMGFEHRDEPKWLLTQAAMAEMYARLSTIDRRRPGP